MVNNQTEFNNKYNDKEIKEIEIKRNRNFQGSLIIEDYLELKKLNLRDVKSVDKVILKNLTDLQECTIWNCSLQDLVIKNCPQIKSLNIRRNSLASLEFLVNLENLETLEWDGNTKLSEILEPYEDDWKACQKDLQESNENTNTLELLKKVRILEKEKSDLSSQLEISQQKYENLKKFLKEILVSLSKENQEELVNELNNEIKTREKNASSVYSTEITIIKTSELTSSLRLSIEEIKELKEGLETKLTESEKKIQELEKQLSEAKARAEKRQKEIEGLNDLTIFVQTPVYQKTINFLKAKSCFLNARRETIEELQKCYNKWDKFGRKNTVVSEIGNTISNIGGATSSTTIFGVIPKAIGEVIKSGNHFSKVVISEKRSKEFEISLVDEKELTLLNDAYYSLISLTRDFTREDEKKFSDLLGLRLIDGREELFGKGKKYKIFNILDGVWKDRYLSLEKMESAIISLAQNLNGLESEWKEQFNKLIDKLKVSRRYGDLIIKDRDIQLQIQQLQSRLNELINSAKDKLKSNDWSTEARESKNKQRELLLNNFLGVQAEITRLSDITSGQEKLTFLQKELLEIALRHDHKEFKKELDNLRQTQVELTKSELELEDLKSQQQEAQILSPTFPDAQFNWGNS